MTVQEIKKAMDKITLETLQDDVDLDALQKFLDREVYSKGMGVTSVHPLPLPPAYEKGQAFRLHLFYDSAYGANRGCLYPQDCPYTDIMMGGVFKSDDALPLDD